MFEGCQSLSSIDLSSCVNSNIKKMNNIFKECPSLEYIDISSFQWDDSLIDSLPFFYQGSGKLIINRNFSSYINMTIGTEWTNWTNWTILIK